MNILRERHILSYRGNIMLRFNQMKKQNICILLLILSMSLFASCQLLTKSGKYENEGEAEKVRIRNYFKANYKPEIYKKFAGKSEIKTVEQITRIEYDSVTVILNAQVQDLKNLFLSGLLSGNMINGINAKTISVCCLEELTYLRTKKYQRRFKFLVFYENYMNPSVFLIELTNNEADNKTSLNAFIKGAELTFIRRTWIQI